MEKKKEEKKRRRRDRDVRRGEKSSAVQYIAEGRGEETRAAQRA